MTWLVAFLADNEFRVLTRARREREHEPFLPVYRTQAGQERPLYPGYLFLRYHHRWPSALKIQGVARILGHYEGETFWPNVLSDDVIDALRHYRPEDGIEPDPYRKGELVKIVGGAWSGFFGTFKRQRHGHGVVDLDFMRRIVEIYIPLQLLARPTGTSTAGEAA